MIAAMTAQLREFVQATLALILDDGLASASATITVTGEFIDISIKFTDERECARFIGATGASVQAFRRLVYSAALRRGIHTVNVDVIDPSGRHSSRRAQEPPGVEVDP